MPPRHEEAAVRLGPTDRRKLDESIREIERQIEKAEKDNSQIDPHMEKPSGVPADFGERFNLLSDVITVAFQADLTRVLTFLVTREGASRRTAKSESPMDFIRSHTIAGTRSCSKCAQINSYHLRQRCSITR